MKTKKTTQKRWPPGKPLPKLATAAEEERFWLSHDFDEAMEAGGEEVTYEPQATRQARTHVYRVRLDDLEMSTLQALAKRRGVNASVVLRELVRAARPRPAKAGQTATKLASAGGGWRRFGGGLNLIHPRRSVGSTRSRGGWGQQPQRGAGGPAAAAGRAVGPQRGGAEHPCVVARGGARRTGWPIDDLVAAARADRVSSVLRPYLEALA